MRDEREREQHETKDQWPSELSEAPKAIKIRQVTLTLGNDKLKVRWGEWKDETRSNVRMLYVGQEGLLSKLRETSPPR